jgi:hypothetical protein
MVIDPYIKDGRNNRKAVFGRCFAVERTEFLFFQKNKYLLTNFLFLLFLLLFVVRMY